MGATEQPTLTVKLDSASVAWQTEAEERPPRTSKKRKVQKCTTLDHSTRGHSFQLPSGLVGTRSTAEVTINGELQVNCLLDTGSQVTTVPHSFYEQHLGQQEIKPLHDLLEVEGANGQSVPYLGYIEITVGFPQALLGVSIEVPTLALVVPDVQANSQPLVLIGTNTMDVLYDTYSDGKSANYQPAHYGYQAVIKVLELRRRQAAGGHGIVKLPNSNAEVIPAGKTIVIEGIAVTNNFREEKTVVVEHPSSSSLPGGLIVKACLVDLPSQRPFKLPVIVSNISEHDVVVPVGCRLADISTYQSVLSQQHFVNTPVSAGSPQKPNLHFNFGESPIPPEWKERVVQQLNRMPEVFAQHDLDFGRTDKVAHRIKLSDETPFKQRPRPIHPADIEAVRKHIQELLDTGVIRESESPFSSPIVVVRKKNGTVRLCIDYRKLNLQTIKDAYALPKLEDTFSALSGSQWFSVLDLKSGYYQIEVEEADKPKTAFVCPLGFWEFNRMPQGVTNAPGTFQRLMERCVGDMHLKEVLVFLDDLIVFSATLEEHQARLMRVLGRLKEFGLKLSPEKCSFFQTSVKYLGHVVSRKGVETDPEKIASLKTWPVPQNLRELRSFLGFAGYYRRFVKGYSNIVKPLHALTSGYPPPRKKSNLKQPTGEAYHNPKELFGGRWTPACQQAFEQVIESLTTAPVLGFADPQRPYVLHTDASTSGLGAVLYQEQEGQLRVIAYASRGLSRSESRYPAHKLEFLALKWSVAEKFCDYLYGNHFTVVTDSNPLTYILTTAKLDATSYRWLATLSTFSFKLVYRPGKLNADADGLSRRPHGELSDDPKSQKERERIRQFTRGHLSDPDNINAVDQAVVTAICERQLVYSDNLITHGGAALIETLTTSTRAVPEIYGKENPFGGPFAIPHLNKDELASRQRADQCLKHVIHQLECGERPPPALRQELPELPLLLRELPRIELHGNVLYRKRRVGPETFYQLVLPAELRDMVLTSLHDHMGHMGADRTLDLVRTRFFWPKMALDVERKVKTCGRCVRRKALPEKAAPLVNINTTRPLELLCMDFLSLEPDRSGTKDILVITDHFTKFAVAIPTPNQKARTVAKCLWDHFIVHYGFPEKLLSDQGPDFESRMIKELCQVASIHKIRTTPYHPRGNPVERFNRTLLNMLGTLTNEEKPRWREFVKPLVHAYNCTRNEVTGFTPYELMFGRQPRLPVDLAFGLPVQGGQRLSHSQYVQTLKSRLQESYKMATANAAKTANRNKTRYDKRVTASDLDVGDRVLIRNVRLRGKHKISDKWEATVHVVVRRAGTLPVYTVKPENAEGPLRTLHRDLLLPCGYLPTEDRCPSQSARRRPVTRSTPSPEEPTFSDNEEDEIIPACWFWDPSRDPAPTFQSPAECDPEVFPDQENHHLILLPDPPDHVVESSPNVQRVDLPGCDDRLVKSDCTANVPLVHDQPDDHLNDTEHSTIDIAAIAEPVNSTEIDCHDKQCDEPADIPDDACADGTEGTCVSDTCEQVSSIRQSTRMRDQPNRLHYAELGNPLLAMMQSFLRGLSAFADTTLSDGSVGSSSLVPPVVTAQPLPCHGTGMSSRGESVAQAL